MSEFGECVFCGAPVPGVPWATYCSSRCERADRDEDPEDR